MRSPNTFGDIKNISVIKYPIIKYCVIKYPVKCSSDPSTAGLPLHNAIHNTLLNFYINQNCKRLYFYQIGRKERIFYPWQVHCEIC